MAVAVNCIAGVQQDRLSLKTIAQRWHGGMCCRQMEGFKFEMEGRFFQSCGDAVMMAMAQG